MTTIEGADLLADFEEGRIDPASFPHRDHVRVSYELLERHPFPETLLHLARGLRRLAAKAGRSEVYHETITAAFLALIAERRLRGRYAAWEDFAASNPDLFRKELLDEIYEPAVLKSPVARATFVLPLSAGTNRNDRDGAVLSEEESFPSIPRENIVTPASRTSRPGSADCQLNQVREALLWPDEKLGGGNERKGVILSASDNQAAIK